MAAGPIPPPLSSSLTTAPPAQPTSPYMQSGMVGGAQEGTIDATQLKLFIEQSFQGAVLMEEHQVHVVLYIPASILHCYAHVVEYWNPSNLKTPQQTGGVMLYNAMCVYHLTPEIRLTHFSNILIVLCR